MNTEEVLASVTFSDGLTNTQSSLKTKEELPVLTPKRSGSLPISIPKIGTQTSIRKRKKLSSEDSPLLNYPKDMPKNPTQIVDDFLADIDLSTWPDTEGYWDRPDSEIPYGN